MWQRWWHTECDVDNSNKEQIRIYEGHGCDQLTGKREYELHWRRVQEGSDKNMLARWHKSELAAEFKKLTATPKRPEGVLVGRKMLIKWRCACIKKREVRAATHL